jgi:hypothetical protein
VVDQLEVQMEALQQVEGADQLVVVERSLPVVEERQR